MMGAAGLMLALQMLWNKWELSTSTKMFTYPLNNLYETIKMELITSAGHFPFENFVASVENVMIEVVFFIRIPLVSTSLSLSSDFCIYFVENSRKI